MLSNRPYLLRAFYEWINDSSCTPFLVVNAFAPKCFVPEEFIEKNGEIILNISPDAVRDLKITHKLIEFRASFSGIVHNISVPVGAVLSIYAHENGQGMFFDYEEDMGDEGEGVDTAEDTKAVKKGVPHLTVVK